jgi:hypothetical protein
MHPSRRLAAATIALAAACAAPALAATPTVEMTWMSIANWYFKIGETRIVMDGYVTRVPENLFMPSPVFPKDLYTYTKGPYGVDLPAIGKVRAAMLGTDKLDLLLAGHAHFDHSWDTPAWSRMTGAPMVGSLSVCLQASTQGVASDACRVVSGGEKIVLGDGITMRVVRWNHSGDATNPIQHFARELYRPPVPDPATGGLRAGVGEDYPNGGGNRAFLITVDSPEGQLSLFVTNSASAFDLDKDVIIDGVSYGSPLGNLAAAMKDAGLTQVDAWIATGGLPVAQMVVPVLHPKAYLPSHWDGLFNPFWAGMPYPFKDDALRAYLDSQKIPLVAQTQYFDKFVLSRSGVARETNHAVKRALGFADEQRFSGALLEAVDRVAATTIGDDCGEGFVEPSPWARTFADLDR